MLFKGVLVSMAGPAPNYDMQRILAAKNPKEASLMSGVVNIALMLPRYFMVGGIIVLALVFFSPQIKAMGNEIDFELILPFVINKFLPVGITGLLMAGLLAAFMSTFDSTVNAGAAYIVNDIYKRYINPQASDKRLIFMSYFCSLMVVVIGITFGFFVESIDSVTKWIVSGLFGSYTAANVLKWHWWRLNGFGYFWGMLIGLIAALLFPIILPSWTALECFPLILVISLAGCFLGSYLTEPQDEETLKNFYKNVRPWGFWGPVHDKVVAEDPSFEGNKNFKRDTFNVIIGIIWQTSIMAGPLYFVIHDFVSMSITLTIFIITTLILKFTWYDKLEEA
jgi:Na+/proline symporter